jgi:hypothetical protein
MLANGCLELLVVSNGLTYFLVSESGTHRYVVGPWLMTGISSYMCLPLEDMIFAHSFLTKLWCK